MSDIKSILSELVSFPSITPTDAGCQKYMIQYLEQIGFSCLQLNDGPVSNFFAVYGNIGPLLVFAGHTDVVPVGECAKWNTEPFLLEDNNGTLYGRGVADMKGSLACMMHMAERFVKSHPTFLGRLGFLVTSGEEGDDFNHGTPFVMEKLSKKKIQLDYCVVGEPSSSKKIGDVIKIGRRGSLSAKINLRGIQGHVAYPSLADNPIHKISPVLAELTSTNWDSGNAFFPPTSMQITHIHSGGHAGNIIPGEITVNLNFRFSTEQTEESLRTRVQHSFQRHNLNPTINWRLNGEPFLTNKGILLDTCKQVILDQTGYAPELSTSGGTSDGRFIAPYGVEVIELGPINATIHQVNECVILDDLHQLEAMYYAICERLLLN